MLFTLTGLLGKQTVKGDKMEPNKPVTVSGWFLELIL